ncbi:MAG TPA: L-aspartate oxidase [Armatimonadota bacterium]|jgi:L-aspartate oxidase
MHSDTLVIGSGIAGLWAALKAADSGTVTILTKKEESESNTNYAQGGIAGAISRDDAPRLHLVDTLEAGAGICHEDAVDVLVREGPQRIRELIDFGAHFSTIPGEKGEELALGMEGGHSRRRIVHAKDLTGREIERALLTAVRLHPHITMREKHLALDLLVDGNVCYGATALDRQTRDIGVFTADATVLASGGLGQVYPHTTNPEIATGDGVAMAWRAGATVANMEFIQFHPTTLYHPDAKSFLISEAVRGEGAVLRLSDGSTFMEKYHRLASLAPRDVVARAIDTETKARGEDCAYLDITHKSAAELEARFPHIYATCLQFGIDMATQWIPVVPAAHYSCGGVVTDLHGRTSIDRLWASGEVTCTGVHGANRLASNSLLEAVVFSERAAEEIAQLSPVEGVAPEASIPEGTAEPNGVEALTARLRAVMWRHVAIVRTDAGLAEAAGDVAAIRAEVEAQYSGSRLTGALVEARNLATAAALIVECARRRKESRGLNTNTDHPDAVESERHDTVLSRAAGDSV